jgi:hypothetical protein
MRVVSVVILLECMRVVSSYYDTCMRVVGLPHTTRYMHACRHTTIYVYIQEMHSLRRQQCMYRVVCMMTRMHVSISTKYHDTYACIEYYIQEMHSLRLQLAELQPY